MSDKEPLKSVIDRLHPEFFTVACDDSDQTVVIFGREYPGSRRCKLTEIKTSGKILVGTQLVPNDRFPQDTTWDDYNRIIGSIRNFDRLIIVSPKQTV